MDNMKSNNGAESLYIQLATRLPQGTMDELVALFRDDHRLNKLNSKIVKDF